MHLGSTFGELRLHFLNTCPIKDLLIGFTPKYDCEGTINDYFLINAVS